MSNNRTDISMDLLPEAFRSMPNEPDIEAVASWLKQLPMANAQKTCDVFRVFLTTINSQHIAPKSRFEIIEQLRPLLLTLSPVLDFVYTEKGFPLDERSRGMAQLLLQCYFELSKSYKLVADDVAFSDSRLFSIIQRATVLHRSLQTRSLAQTRIAQLYEAPPAQFWREAYDVFLMAESLGVANEWIQDSEVNDTNKSTIAHVFKLILLFSMSNPNRYRQNNHKHIYSLIEQFASLCGLAEASMLDGRKATFYFDFDQDCAPRHMSHMEPDTSGKLRYLFTRRMVEEIIANIHMLTVADKRSPLCQRLERPLVFRIIRSLGAPERRKSMRISEDDERPLLIGMRPIIDAIIDSRYRELRDPNSSPIVNQPVGAKNIFLGPEEIQDNDSTAVYQSVSSPYQYVSEKSGRFIAKVKPVNVPDYKLMPVDDGWNSLNIDGGRNENRSENNMAGWFRKPEREQVTFEDIWGDTSENVLHDQLDNKQSSNSACKLINSSVTGYSMVWLDNGPEKIKVGELIGFPLEDNRFELGSVCWIFNSEEGQLSFGIELLSASADVTKIKFRDRSSGSSYALLLSDDEDGIDILLTPSEYKIGDSLELDTDVSQGKYSLEKLVESTGAYSRYSLVRLEVDRQEVG